MRDGGQEEVSPRQGWWWRGNVTYEGWDDNVAATIIASKLLDIYDAPCGVTITSKSRYSSAIICSILGWIDVYQNLDISLHMILWVPSQTYPDREMPGRIRRRDSRPEQVC